MDTDQRVRCYYVRQKVWEALCCLVGPQRFRDRLTAAAMPVLSLTTLHSHLLAELTEEVQQKFDDVVDALTEHPPEWKGDSVAAASVRRMTYRQRIKVANDILSIYVSVSGGL